MFEPKEVYFPKHRPQFRSLVALFISNACTSVGLAVRGQCTTRVGNSGEETRCGRPSNSQASQITPPALRGFFRLQK